MIGLEKAIVWVVPYHPSWHDVVQQERHVLQKHIGGQVLDIQYIGSAAVPRLDASPITGILIVALLHESPKRPLERRFRSSARQKQLYNALNRQFEILGGGQRGRRWGSSPRTCNGWCASRGWAK